MTKKRYKAIKDPNPKAIIIHCSDPRFRIAFRDFTIEELGFKQGESVPINVAGGPAVLAHKKKKYNDFRYLIDQILFFIRHFESIRTVFLVGHQDCGFYKNFTDHPDEENREKKDLPRAAEAISETLDAEGIKVKSYYAKFADEDRAEIVFEKVQ